MATVIAIIGNIITPGMVFRGALSILASALILFWALKMFKVDKRNYGYCLIIAALVYSITLGTNLFLDVSMGVSVLTIPGLIISFVTTWLLLIRYKIPIGKLILIWIIWTVLNWIVSFILVAILEVVWLVIAVLQSGKYFKL